MQFCLFSSKQRWALCAYCLFVWMAFCLFVRSMHCLLSLFADSNWLLCLFVKTSVCLVEWHACKLIFCLFDCLLVNLFVYLFVICTKTKMSIARMFFVWWNGTGWQITHLLTTDSVPASLCHHNHPAFEIRNKFWWNSKSD